MCGDWPELTLDSQPELLFPSGPGQWDAARWTGGDNDIDDIVEI